ncbi:MAG: nitroreductase family protein [Bacteroidota bacterium]
MNTTPPDSIIAKAPHTQYPIQDLIRKRWSARAFANRPIDADTLNTLFEAATWAASSMNEQPWVYLYAHRSDSENFSRFFDCLMTGNQLWAKDAPVLVLALARKTFAKNGNPNRHALHDVGSANTTLLLEAAAHDIYGHMMGGFVMEKTVETFSLTEDYEPACFLALGYLGDPDALQEPFRERELAGRSRKPLNEIAFRGGLPQ